ncbi:MAG: formylglycine-generating enzyme family protein [Myxococcota bacterium]
MYQADPDPSARTNLWSTLGRWQGDFVELAGFVGSLGDEPFVADLCRGMGMMSTAETSSEVRDAWRPILEQWYTKTTRAETHSAAGWALRQWSLPLPGLQTQKAPKENPGWYVNPAGMTLLRVERGTFLRDYSHPPKPQEVEITRPFYIGDREVTRAQFLQFRDDPVYSEKAKPKNWKPVDLGTVADAIGFPAGGVDWSDAVLFCIWLSHLEGLEPAYVKSDSVWQLNRAADGYRLPTEAEWEYSCRAGTTFAYGIGQKSGALKWMADTTGTTLRSGAVGMPNFFGLFDLHGNLQEWCTDYFQQAYENKALVQDPLPEKVSRSRVVRGGSYNTGVKSWRVWHRSHLPPTSRAFDAGFRVLRPVSGPE